MPMLPFLQDWILCSSGYPGTVPLGLESCAFSAFWSPFSACVNLHVMSITTTSAGLVLADDVPWSFDQRRGFYFFRMKKGISLTIPTTFAHKDIAGSFAMYRSCPVLCLWKYVAFLWTKGFFYLNQLFLTQAPSFVCMKLYICIMFTVGGSWNHRLLFFPEVFTYNINFRNPT